MLYLLVLELSDALQQKKNDLSLFRLENFNFRLKKKKKNFQIIR